MAGSLWDVDEGLAFRIAGGEQASWADLDDQKGTVMSVAETLCFAERIFGAHPCAHEPLPPYGPDGEGEAGGQVL